MYQIRTSDGMNDTMIVKDKVLWIPQDEANLDYQEYLAWVAEGNEPEEWAPEEVSE